MQKSIRGIIDLDAYKNSTNLHFMSNAQCKIAVGASSLQSLLSVTERDELQFAGLVPRPAFNDGQNCDCHRNGSMHGLRCGPCRLRFPRSRYGHGLWRGGK